MGLSLFRNLTPLVLTAMLTIIILALRVLSLNRKWTNYSKKSLLLAEFLVLPLSPSAYIPLAVFLKKTWENRARLRIVADRMGLL